MFNTQVNQSGNLKNYGLVLCDKIEKSPNVFIFSEHKIARTALKRFKMSLLQ